MKKIVLVLAVFSMGIAARAQYNTISGTVWRDNNLNNLRDAGEELVAGIVVTMVLPRSTTDTVISTAITDGSGFFTLNNYAGTGTYYLNYIFPSAGFTIATGRVGSNNTLNSAADETTVGNIDNNIVSTPNFTISSSTNISNTYGLGLQRINTTLTYWTAKALSATDWSNTFALPKSNNSVGTLTKATIFGTNVAYHPSMGIENTSSSSSSPNAMLTANGQLTLSPPTGSAMVSNTTASHAQSLGIADGVTDFGGTSGMTWYNAYGFGFIERPITNATQLNSYKTSTPSNISINGVTTSVASFSGGGNLTASVVTSVGAGVFITYTYSAAVTLPVKFSSFTAIKEENTALIQWVAASQHNLGFIVERSIDGRNFTEIGSVADNGNGMATSGYSFRDSRPLAGKNLYRLKMTDDDGTVTYTAVLSVNFEKVSLPITVYPNPVAKVLTVDNIGIGDRLSVLSVTGQVMMNITAIASGKQVLDIAALPAGLYIVQLNSKDGFAGSVRFTKQ